MSWLSALGGVLAGLFGRELWEWLPCVTRALIKVVTLPLPADRREIRRSEWSAELEHFKQRRISALLWALSLLPICLWEAVTERGALRRFGWFVLQVLMVYVAVGLPFIPKSLEFLSRWGLSMPEAVVFMAVAPIAMGGGLIVMMFIIVPLVLALPGQLILRWAEARSRRDGD